MTNAPIQKAAPLNMEDLVSIQERSVVSREIMRNEAGNVTVFAFDSGEGLSEHSAPFDAMVYILQGSMVITISKVPHTLKQCDFIIMPANEPHALTAKEKTKMLLVMLKG